MNVSSAALQHILALAKIFEMDDEQPSAADGGDEMMKQPLNGEDAMEMAKTLCALSEAVGDDVQNGTSAENGLSNDAGEKNDAGMNEQQMIAAIQDIGINERQKNNCSLSLEQPISIEIHGITTTTSTTTSSSSSGIASDPQANREKIYKGVNFTSFADFEAAFEEWKQVYHHPFRVASSEKHEDRMLADRFKYRYVVYHCSRYGEPRKRGAGRRPHQNYLPCGCNAKLRLNFHDKDGSLQVTTLETHHNHEPMMEDGSLGGTLGSAKRRKNSPTEETAAISVYANGSVKEEHSPNSTTSSIAAITSHGMPAQFSPLSLQSAMHNSPSSGGQSSSEGVNEAIGLSVLGLISPSLQKHHHNQQQQQQMFTPSMQQSRQSQHHGKPLISPLAQSANANELSAYLAKIKEESMSAAAMADQKVPMSTPSLSNSQQEQTPEMFRRQMTTASMDFILQELLRTTTAATGISQSKQEANETPVGQGGGRGRQSRSTQVHQSAQSLLGRTPQTQQPQQQSVTTSASSFLSAALLQQLQQQQTTPMTSSPNSAAILRQSQQQRMSSSSATSSSTAINNNSLLSLLQLQLLINSSTNASTKPSPTIQNQIQNNQNNNNMNANAHLLQQLLAVSGQQQQQQIKQEQPRNFGSNINSSSNILGISNFGSNFVGAADQLEAMSRNEMIREADLLVQMLVNQMIRTRDLSAYLRRLRQFLAENFD